MKSSKKPNKQRRRLYNAPKHQRGKQFNAPLDEALVDKYHVKRMPIRVNDQVRVFKGQFKDLEGKVLRVDRKKYKVIVEQIEREKADGSVHHYPIHPSKVVITKINDVDKRRQAMIDRRNFIEYEKAKEAKTIGKKGKK